MTEQRKPPINLIKGRRRTAKAELEEITEEVSEFLQIAESRVDWQNLLDEVEIKQKDLLSVIQSYAQLNEEYLALLGENLPDDTDCQEFQQWEMDSKDGSKALRCSKSVASKLELKQKFLGRQIQSVAGNEAKKMKEEKDELDRQMKQEMDKLSLQTQKEIELERIKNGTPLGTTRERMGASHCKLPKVEITKFDGNKLEFWKFWGKFQNAVDNQDMPAVQKLTYLLEFMKPGSEAYRALDGIEVIDSNYDLACKILKDRFGDQHAIKNMHYKELLKVTCTGGKTAELRNFYDTVEKHVRPLQLMEFDCNNGMFLSLLQSKLPEFISLKMLEMNKNMEIKDFETFQTLLGLLIKSKETVSENSEKPNSPYSYNKEEARDKVGFQKQKFNQYSVHNRFVKPQSTTGALYGATVNKGQGTKKPEAPTCFCCEGTHFLDQCEKYPDAKSIKARLAEMKDVCHRCFRSGHRTQDCFVKKPCFYCKKSDHHNALCPDRARKQLETKSASKSGSGTVSCNVVDAIKCKKQVLFPTAQVLVRKPENTNAVKSRVLLDSACNQTFITTNLAKQLGVKTKEPGTATAVFVFSQKKAKELVDKEAKVEIKLKDGTWKKLNVKVIPHITNQINKAPEELWDTLAEWNNLDYAEPIMEGSEPTPMDMLIGGDYYGQIFQGRKIDVNGKISLHKSSLGWIPMGQVNIQNGHELNSGSYYFNLEQTENEDIKQFSTCVNQQVSTLQNWTGSDLNGHNLALPPNLEDMWSLETIGIMDSPYVSDDEKALEYFKKTVVFENNRYQTRWPYKNEDPNLPENMGMAKGQLRSLWNRNQENMEILQKIDEIIKDQLAKEIIEVVDAATLEGQLKHYVPFHAVVTPSNQTTKTRIVYNASAKQKGKCCLNECLYRGPPVISDLCGMLLRFRLGKVAMIADVEKAFLQVGLQVPDRDVTRFFWLKDYKQAPSEQNLVIYRFTRVPFGVVSSPFLLMATIFHHLDKDGSLVAQKIKQNIYMDNVLIGVNSTAEGKEFYDKAKELFSSASMNLREWSTNGKELLETIPDKDRINGNNVKVLGLRWDFDKDHLHLSGKSDMFQRHVITKRDILKQMARIFDPLGFFLPVTVRIRFLWREICKKNSNWDEKIEEQFLFKWKELAKDVPEILQLRIPRWSGWSNETKRCDLICFTDASEIAYSAVVYMRLETTSESKVILLFAKSRLSPLKTISIPRLELMGVLIGTEAVKFVEKELHIPVDEKILFTDSECVLNWIKRDGKWSIFVENRIKKIRENTEGKAFSFRFVSTLENPADISTKGVQAKNLKQSLWWEGPPWLKHPKEYWPTYDQKEVTKETWEKIEAESKRNSTMYSTGSYVAAGGMNQKGIQDELQEVKSPFGIKMENYGSLNKLLRITAMCLKAWQRFKRTVQGNERLIAKELQTAKVMWEQYVQKMYYSEERKLLMSGKSNNLIRSLRLKLDEKSGLIRVHGRMDNLDLTEKNGQPKLLPRQSHYTSLVIQQTHEHLLHSGTTHTLCIVRQEYWICQGRAEVRSILKQCRICRKNDAGPYTVPMMPPLPTFRVQKSVPFTYVGLDYLGPLTIKTEESGSRKKVWICLFTCLTVRAIHLELVSNLSAEQFIQAMRRFIARRGQPEKIISDNAAQFKAVQKLLVDILIPTEKDVTVLDYSANRGIDWQFITELAPWMGGFYERLVGLVKTCLKKAIGKRLLKENQLETFMAEVEATVNSRPIVPVGNEVEDQLALAPVDFLNCRKLGAPNLLDKDEEADPEYVERLSSKEKLIKAWRQEQRQLNEFWHMWYTQYLDSLRERQIIDLNQKRNTSKEIPEVGDVVLVKQDRMPRGCWKMGRIQKLKLSSDDEVRVASVKLPNGTIIQRSIKQLFPIECSASSNDEKEVQKPDKKDEQIVRERPIRKAAIKAKEKMQNQLRI